MYPKSLNTLHPLITLDGSREESEVAGVFVFLHIRRMGYLG